MLGLESTAGGVNSYERCGAGWCSNRTRHFEKLFKPHTRALVGCPVSEAHRLTPTELGDRQHFRCEGFFWWPRYHLVLYLNISMIIMMFNNDIV